MIRYDVFSSATDFADSISLIRTIASTGTYSREYFTHDTHSPDPEISGTGPGVELQFFELPFFWEVVSLSTCSGFSTRTSEILCGRRGISKTAVTRELLGWTSKRTPLHQTNSAPPFAIKGGHQKHIPPLPVAADPSICSSICIHSSS